MSFSHSWAKVLSARLWLREAGAASKQLCQSPWAPTVPRFLASHLMNGRTAMEKMRDLRDYFIMRHPTLMYYHFELINFFKLFKCFIDITQLR